MPKPPGPGLRLIEAACEEWPDLPTMTLAKKLYRAHPELWPSVEGCRSMVRYARGNSGDSHRRRTASCRPDCAKPNAAPGDPFDALPKGKKHYNDWGPHEIKAERVLIVADTHVPYHDERALRVALEKGVEKECDHVLLLGDFMDFFSVSFWEKDPRERDFAGELEIGIAVLDIIRQAFPDAGITYKIGNHEERYERYMKLKAPELLGVSAFEIENLLEFDDFGIEKVADRRVVKLGKLNALHGHEFGRGVFSPVNPARGLYTRGQEHAIAGHWHRTSAHAEKTLNEHVVTCYSVGCLSDLHPDYSPINKWNHGFAVVHLDGNKFEVENYKIIDGKAYR